MCYRGYLWLRDYIFVVSLLKLKGLVLVLKFFFYCKSIIGLVSGLNNKFEVWIIKIVCVILKVIES